MKKTIACALLLLCLLVSSAIWAQQQPVTGKVNDQDGRAIAGASITVKGTTRGTVTDPTGSFSIAASPGETLIDGKVTYQKGYMHTGYFLEKTAGRESFRWTGAGNMELNLKLERRIELPGEGHRWLDLVRWGDAPTVSGPRGFKAGKHEYLPIPILELENTKIEQTKEWGGTK